VPEDALVRQDSPPVSPTDSPMDNPPDKLIKVLEAHVETLKAQLAAAEARIDKQAEDLVAYDAAYAAGLTAERAKVEAEKAKAEKALAAAESRAEKQASDFAAREAQQAASLAAEQAKTEKAIAAFASLADRLDALAAERAKPWWRRLAG
jgi:fused signal recognition particle receptor